MSLNYMKKHRNVGKFKCKFVKNKTLELLKKYVLGCNVG